MKITKIEQQVKNQRRYSIYVDDKYAFSLNESQLADSRLKQGQELTRDQLTEFRQDSDYGKLYERTLKWLAIRPRSAWELDTYLARITNSESHKDKLTKKLQSLGLIDDQKFAESWVTSRRILKSISQRRLWQELAQKRVSKDIIEQVLKDDETDEVVVIRELVDRKAHQYPDRQKLLAYLSRQGFRYDNIKQVLSESDN